MLFRRPAPRTTRRFLMAAGLLVSGGIGAQPLEDDTLGHSVALVPSGAGTLEVAASVAGVDTTFLLDTGAGVVTVSETLFAAVRKVAQPRPVREMAGRLASGKIERIRVYAVDDFTVGDCNLGTVEVAVMRGKGRNLLGLSALKPVAPITIALDPPALTLSQCALPTATVAALD